MLQSVYSDYPWLLWRFKTVSLGYWKDKKNHRKFMEWIGEQLNFKKMEDWYTIKHQVGYHDNH